MAEEKCSPFYQIVDGHRIPGAFLPETFRSALQYKPEAGDVFVCTFPKCGTNWVGWIITNIYLKGQRSAAEVVGNGSPLLEMVGSEGASLMRKPGCFKSHLTYESVPKSPDAKYLYLVRNPKDTLVSFYHHTSSIQYKWSHGDFNDYFEIFMKGENDFGDYFDHVLGWYEHRQDPNVLFLTYEELKKDTKNTVKKIGKFLGDEYGRILEEDEEVLSNVLKYSSVEYMKTVVNDEMDSKVENASQDDSALDAMPAGLKHVIKFMSENQIPDGKKFHLIRKGIVGDWRNNFTEEQARRMDDKTEAKLKETDIYNYWKSIDCI